MPTGTAAFFTLAQLAVGTTQEGLGQQLGISRRTAQRWCDHGVPSYALADLARVVVPHDRALAREIAKALGTTLQALGIDEAAAPKAPSPPAPPPPPTARQPDDPPDGIVDALVCAAAEAMGASPADARKGLLAGFTRAREIGASALFVERVLRDQVDPPPDPRKTAPKR
jgi:hypothetical protein